VVGHYGACMDRRVARAWLAGGGVLVVLTVTAPGGAPQALGHAAVNGLSAAAVLTGIVRNRPRTPWAWLGLALSLSIYAVTNLAWAAQAAGVGGTTARYVDVVLKPLAFLMFSLSLFEFLRDGRLPLPRAALLDGLLSLFAGGMVLLVWIVLGLGDPGTLTLVNLLAPVALTGLTIGFVVIGHRMSRDRAQVPTSMLAVVAAAALALLGMALVVLLQPAAPRWVDGTWLLASVLNGAAALHPSMAWPAPAGSPRRVTLTPTRRLVLGAALLANPFVVWLSTVMQAGEALVLALGVVGIGALAMVGITATEVQDRRDGLRGRHSFRVG